MPRVQLVCPFKQALEIAVCTTSAEHLPNNIIRVWHALLDEAKHKFAPQIELVFVRHSCVKALIVEVRRKLLLGHKSSPAMWICPVFLSTKAALLSNESDPLAHSNARSNSERLTDTGIRRRSARQWYMFLSQRPTRPHLRGGLPCQVAVGIRACYRVTCSNHGGRGNRMARKKHHLREVRKQSGRAAHRASTGPSGGASLASPGLRQAQPERGMNG